MERYSWLDEFLLLRPGTEKEFMPAWQAYKYMLRGKMFAYIGINDQNGRALITLKLDPSYSCMLRQAFSDVIPGYYMNKLHWSSVYLDGAVPREILSGIVRESYTLMLKSLSKKAQHEIQGEGERKDDAKDGFP